MSGVREVVSKPVGYEADCSAKTTFVLRWFWCDFLKGLLTRLRQEIPPERKTSNDSTTTCGGYPLQSLKRRNMNKPLENRAMHITQPAARCSIQGREDYPRTLIELEQGIAIVDVQVVPPPAPLPRAVHLSPLWDPADWPRTRCSPVNRPPRSPEGDLQPGRGSPGGPAGQGRCHPRKGCARPRIRQETSAGG